MAGSEVPISGRFVVPADNGIVVAWGYGTNQETNVPPNLTNVVAIAAGRYHSLALSNNGTVAAWGAGTNYNPSDGVDFGQSIVPAGLSNVMAVAAGDFHSVALKNDGTLVVWGDNSSGQTNIPAEQPTAVIGGSPPLIQTNFYPPIVFKLIAAGGNHTMAAIWSPLVQYPIDVSKDLLLIFNTNSVDSWNVCQYYTNNRPMVANANILGIGCTTNETAYPVDFTNDIEVPIQNWLALNPTKRPAYVVLFQDIPSRSDNDVGIIWPDGYPGYDEAASDGTPSVQYQLNQWCATNWHPFVTSINMNGTNGSLGTNDCIAYINKLAYIASNYCSNQLVISASAGGYGNANWYFDDSRIGGSFGTSGHEAELAVLAAEPSAYVFYSNNAAIITNGINVAGYYSPGTHNLLFLDIYPVDNEIVFSGASSWYIMETDESFNGQRYSVNTITHTGQGNFLEWFSSGAFGGANYSNTPVGAVCNVNEPGTTSADPPQYFGLWAAGRIFASCAWNSPNGNGSRCIQAVGDPFIKK